MAAGRMNHLQNGHVSHMYAICAYKESPYLETCIRSLQKQTAGADIIMCTSTPNGKIRQLAQTYGIELFIRDGESTIKDDWNFAYNCAKSDFVTIVHQDDIYLPEYGENIYKCLATVRDTEDVLMCFSDYLPLKETTGTKKDINCRIRRMLRWPLFISFLSDKKWAKKMVLRFGNSICCPTVTYNKALLGDSIFKSPYRFNIDWDTFLMLAEKKGHFLYIDKPLVEYRIHAGATSKAFIDNHKREVEDCQMFLKFWPQLMVKMLMIFYKKAYETYSD